MPGGAETAYAKIKPIFEKAAAKVDGEPCVAYMGPGAAGHYVKMVHNGIEYAIMQSISETYDLLKQGMGKSNKQLHDIYSAWNDGDAGSYLLEITSDIFLKKDPDTNGDLIDLVLDESKQKGTGKWTSQDALDLQVPLPSIDVAVMMRNLSKLRKSRVALDKEYGFEKSRLNGSQPDFEKDLEEAIYFSMLTIFAQGMHLLQEASNTYHFDLHLDEVAKIWRGGCIIRAKLLEKIREAYQEKPSLPHLFFNEYFKNIYQNQKSQSERWFRRQWLPGYRCHLFRPQYLISMPCAASHCLQI